MTSQHKKMVGLTIEMFVAFAGLPALFCWVVSFQIGTVVPRVIYTIYMFAVAIILFLWAHDIHKIRKDMV